MAPVVMPWTELSSGADGKFWECLKFFHATNQQWSSDIVAINNDTWKKIRPEHQAAISAAARKLEPEFWESAFAADREAARKMVDGMTLVTPSDRMMADLRKRTDHLLADFMRKVPSSQAPIKAFLAEVKRG